MHQSHSVLKESLRRSANPVEVALRFVLAWIAQVDDQYGAREEAIIRNALGVPGQDGAESVERAARNPDDEEMAVACKLLRNGLTEAGKELALEIVIMVVVADGRISVSENHALRFLSDVLNRSSEELAAKYYQLCGATLRDPKDLSSASTWTRDRQGAHHESSNSRTDNDRKSRGAGSKEGHKRKSQRDGGKRDSKTGAGQHTMTASEAREILGVEEDANLDEIKRAYRQLAQRTHPDRFRTLGDEAVRTSQVWFDQVQKAYRVLRARR